MKLRAGTPEEAGMSPQRVRHVKELARGWVEEGIHPALVVLVARRGVVVLHEAFGRLTPEDDSPPLARDTIFPIASVTKPITATAAMALVEDGLLSLNRPVSDYVPEFRGEGKEAVMVHHLVTHTSGLQEEDLPIIEWLAHESIESPPADATQHPTIHRMLLNGYDVPLSKPPGKEMSYCNFNYELLGEIIRRLSRKSLAEFAKDRIFDPLGMKDTHFVVPDSLKHRVVRRPSNAPLQIQNEDRIMELPLAAGGVYATAWDMAVFGQMFLNGGRYGDARILSRASVTEMTRNQIPGIPAEGVRGVERQDEASWGYGWGIQGEGKWEYFSGSLSSSELYEHSGGGGIRFWVDPGYEFVLCYFSVVVEMRVEGSGKHNADLFVNAVTAAVQD